MPPGRFGCAFGPRSLRMTVVIIGLVLFYGALMSCSEHHDNASLVGHSHSPSSRSADRSSLCAGCEPAEVASLSTGGFS